MNQKSWVILVPCKTYEEKEVCSAVKTGMKLLENENSLVGEDEKILLKVNLLISGASIEKAITPHPAVFKGITDYFQETGRRHLSYGDSPGLGSMETVAKDCGLYEMAERLGVQPADFESGIKIQYPDGIVAKEFMISKGVLDSDAIVNICKMKTHALERITGAVKISYGDIYGVAKKSGHVQYPNAERFAAMLTDLNRYVKPRFSIMDGIIAMEGNGPASGNSVNMGVLLFSSDPVALDSVFCHLIYLDPQLVPTCTIGQQFGLGNWQEDSIEIDTPDGILSMEEIVKRFGNPDFNVYRGKHRLHIGNSFENMTHIFSSRPVINQAKCIHCGICVETCPVEGKALHFSNGRNNPPVHDYRKCIRCFCCQEMCPQHAIEVGHPWEKVLKMRHK